MIGIGSGPPFSSTIHFSIRARACGQLLRTIKEAWLDVDASFGNVLCIGPRVLGQRNAESPTSTFVLPDHKHLSSSY